jgi:hypothetical protein
VRKVESKLSGDVGLFIGAFIVVVIGLFTKIIELIKLMNTIKNYYIKSGLFEKVMEVAYLNSAKCCNILNILDSLLNNQQ